MRPGLLFVVLLAALSIALLLRDDHEGPGADVSSIEGPASSRSESGDRDPSRAERIEAPATTGEAGSGAKTPGDAEAATRLTGRVVDERGRAIPNAQIRVDRLPSRALRGATAERGEELANAASAPDGTFEVLGLDAGWICVTAEAPAFAAAATWTVAPGAYVELVLPPAGQVDVRVERANGTPVAGARIRVGARRAVHEATSDEEGHARFEALAPGVAHVVATDPNGLGSAPAVEVLVVAGETTAVHLAIEAHVRVGGRVLDAVTGRPIVGAEVHVARPGHAEAAGPTDIEGRFRAVPAATPNRRAYVAVRAPGYAPSLDPVHLGAAAVEIEIEVRLRPAPPWTGRVVGPEGEPVAGARVTYTADGIAGREPPAAVTDEAGRFELPPPPPPAPGRRVLLIAEASVGRAALALRPHQAPPPHLELVLENGRSVSARVVDSDGEPVPGVRLGLVPDWQGLRDRRTPGPSTSRLLAMATNWQESLSATTDAWGQARLRGVPDGRYRPTLAHGRLQVERPHVVIVSKGDVDLGTLVLDEGVEVQGRIQDERGRALSGAAVLLAPRDGRTRARRANADTDGWFRFDAVLPGRARLTAHHPHHVETSTDIEVLENDVTQDLVLESGATIRFRLSQGESPYTGFVIVERRPVTRSGGAASKSRLRARNGTLTLRGIPDGRWLLVVTTLEGANGRPSGPLETRSGASYDVHVALLAGTRMEGRLLSSTHTPVVGGRVSALPDGQSRRLMVTTGKDGHYRFDHLPAGGLGLRAAGPGGAPASEDIVLVPGETRKLDLVLEPGGGIEVVVVDSGGRPVPEALVRARKAGAYPPHHPGTRRTDAKGRATLPDLPPGPVEVSAIHPDGRRGRTSVEIVAGETATTRVTILR